MISDKNPYFIVTCRTFHA